MAETSELTAFDDYLRYGTDEERSKGESSRRVYGWTVERFRRFLHGRDPSPDLAREFVVNLEATNSPRSINRHIWALKSYFRFRKSQGMPGQEFRLRGLTTEKKIPRFLRDEEWITLLGTATKPIYDSEAPDYARQRAKLELALLYAYCGAGLRCSEAVRLQLDDIADEGFVRVRRKGGQEDIVPIEDEVLRSFRDYIESREQNGHYVFPGKDPDTHMAERTAQSIVKSLCRRAGLNDVHVHSLRHTAGYQLRKMGANLRDIQDFLGHKNIATTTIYTQLAREDFRERLPKRFTQARQGRFM